MTDLRQPPGAPSSVEELPAVAKGYLAAIADNSNFELIEIRRADDAGVLIVNAFSGIPPRSPYGVRDIEPLAIEVKEDQAPVVHALRTDFPHLPHQNLVDADKPRQLCLSEVPWEEERATETPPRRLKRITEWLERAGWGRLYARGQPLEPYVFASYRIIVPNDIFATEPGTVYSVIEKGALLQIEPIGQSPLTEAKCLIMPVLVQSTDEQVVHSRPSDFGKLAKLLEPLGVDLVELVRRETKRFVADDKRQLLDLHWLFLIRIPRVTPERSTDSEDIGFWLAECTVGQLGQALGAVVKGGGMIGLDLGYLAGYERRYDLALGTPVPINPVTELTCALAARMSGHEATAPDWRISIIGVGAIGSAIVFNLCRQGQTPRVLVDHDVVLPHNLARYQLPPFAVGLNKAECVALVADGICTDASAPDSFAEDVLKLEEESKAAKALGDTLLVVDCTTSRAAMRRLAQMSGLKRRASCYMTASGSDLVVIAEGADGRPRIDDLDVQFSYACATDSRLEGVMISQQARRVRYAGGCSDLSAVLDESAVMTLSAIASSRIRCIVEEQDSTIRVWRYKDQGPSLDVFNIVPASVSVRDIGRWQLRLSDSVVEQMQRFRIMKLPDETGGVLLGAFDVSRCVVYVAGVLPSPPDSEEWPKSYIRGSRGLRAQVERVSRLSGNEIGYVGEWHSHPEGCVAVLSSDDEKALAQLADTMGCEGLPGVVVVASDREEWAAGLIFRL